MRRGHVGKDVSLSYERSRVQIPADGCQYLNRKNGRQMAVLPDARPLVTLDRNGLDQIKCTAAEKAGSIFSSSLGMAASKIVQVDPTWDTLCYRKVKQPAKQASKQIDKASKQVDKQLGGSVVRDPLVLETDWAAQTPSRTAVLYMWLRPVDSGLTTERGSIQTCTVGWIIIVGWSALAARPAVWGQ